MSAEQNLNQLQFYMTPQEVGGLHSGDYGIPMSRVPSVLHKRSHHDEEKLQGMTQYAETLRGIHEPIRVVHGAEQYNYRSGVIDGHHRSTVAMETNRLIPVEHYDDIHEAQEDTYWDAVSRSSKTPARERTR